MAEPKRTGQYLAFQIAGEEYSLPLLRVQEVVQWGPVTQVPGAPPFLRGAFNLRGVAIPVVDLAVKFGLPPRTPQKRTCLVLVELETGGARGRVGLMVDRVTQLLEVEEAQLKPPPDFGTQVHPDYLRGLWESGAKFVLALDIDLVLSTQELKLAERVRQELERTGAEAVTP